MCSTTIFRPLPHLSFPGARILLSLASRALDELRAKSGLARFLGTQLGENAMNIVGIKLAATAVAAALKVVPGRTTFCAAPCDAAKTAIGDRAALAFALNGACVLIGDSGRRPGCAVETGDTAKGDSGQGRGSRTSQLAIAAIARARLPTRFAIGDVAVNPVSGSVYACPSRAAS